MVRAEAPVRRELAIALRAPAPWLAAALGALVVGHGFVLAIDLYTAASRSVTAGALMARELDPLLGVARPTFGGAAFCLTLLGPLVGARVLAVEAERRTLQARLLAVGSPLRIVVAKIFAAWLALALLVAPVVCTLALWWGVGGRLGVAEAVTLLCGGLLHALLLACVCTAAAAWTRGVAQAATLALAASLGAWVLDAAGEFAAITWLAPLAWLSSTSRLQPFEQGLVLPGALVWLGCACIGATALAYVGLRRDARRSRRVAAAAAIAIATVLGLMASDGLRGGWDTSDARRWSFPPALQRALEALPGPIELEIYLDREDSRRVQLERDVLRRLQLARPDASIRFPIDEATDPLLAVRDEDYGKLEIRVAGASTRTWSTSRKEVVEQIFTAAGEPLGAWEYSSYPGHPCIIEGSQRRTLGWLAYLALPLGCVAVGLWTVRRSRRS
jgi:hypothetical protein